LLLLCETRIWHQPIWNGPVVGNQQRGGSVMPMVYDGCTFFCEEGMHKEHQFGKSVAILLMMTATYGLAWVSAKGAQSASPSVSLIVRRQASNKRCTTGQLILNNAVVGYTLERPWENNLPLISQIPSGLYSAFVRSENGSRWRIELKDVPGRTNIQLHLGHSPANTIGCILVGSNADPAQCTLTNEAAAWEKFKFAFAKVAGGAPDHDVAIMLSIEDAGH
jgi:hypothetical protein